MIRPDWRKFPWQWLPLATDLTQTAKLVWMILNDHQGNKDKSWPFQETLAFEAGVSIATIERALRSLEKKGYLYKRRARLFGAGRNDYVVSHPTLDLPSFEAITGEGTEPITGDPSKPSRVKGYSFRRTNQGELTHGSSGRSAPSRSRSKANPLDLIYIDGSGEGWDNHLERCRSTQSCDEPCPRLLKVRVRGEDYWQIDDPEV